VKEGILSEIWENIPDQWSMYDRKIMSDLIFWFGDKIAIQLLRG